MVRSVINLSLADLAADPDSVNMVEQDIAMTASKVKDPATWAMLQLLRADVTDSVRWADSALVYTDALRRASVKEWREVIVADSVYIPTLYDFAVSMRLDMQPSDSLLSQVLEFHKGEPAPYMYWSLRRVIRNGAMPLICMDATGICVRRAICCCYGCSIARRMMLI